MYKDEKLQSLLPAQHYTTYSFAMLAPVIVTVIVKSHFDTLMRYLWNFDFFVSFYSLDQKKLTDHERENLVFDRNYGLNEVDKRERKL